MSKIGIWVCVGILLFHFTFTSGFVYEALGRDTAIDIDLPYSYALSGDRVGMVGLFNKDDLRCAEWYIDNIGLEPIIAGYNGCRVFVKYEVPPIIWFYNRSGEGPEMPEEGYVFLTTWNVENGEYIRQLGVGLRARTPLPEFKGEVIYQSGKAKIYKLIPPPPPPPPPPKR